MAPPLAVVRSILALGIVLAPRLSAQAPETVFLEAVERMRAAPGAAAEREAAAVALQRFQTLPPELADVHRQQLPAAIEAAVRGGRSELALRWLDELPEVAQASVLPWRLRALVLAGRLPEFRAEAERAVAAGRQPEVEAALLATESSLLPLADRKLRSGAIADGRWVFAQLALARPDDAVRQANLALCLRNLGDTEAAEAAYARARALDPLDPQIENDWGLFLRATGRRAAATAAFRHSLELDSVLPGGRRGQGPAVTNLVHAAALGRDAGAAEALALGCEALAIRPEAAMLRRLVLDLGLDQQLANTGRNR